jgi:glycosyltransferase involved in cell wall biosynthesis
MRSLQKYGTGLKCLIVGVGHFSPLEKKIREAIKRFNLEDRIIMLGWRKREDCLSILANAFCYVTTSRYEGLSLSILEAMSLGKVVIASDVTGNRDCVENNKTGFLVSLNDHEKMAELIINLEKNKELKKSMERQARRLFYQRFDITKTIGSLENIYISVAKY